MNFESSYLQRNLTGWTSSVANLMFLTLYVCVHVSVGNGQEMSSHLAVGSQGQHSIYYEATGNGEPVVFLHGLTLDTRMWDPQWSVFSAGYQVIRYDSIGHGKSSGAAGHAQNSIRREDNLRDLLVHLGIEKAHIIGLSMGAEIGVEFAISYPDMVDSLTLIDGGPNGSIRPGQPFYDRLVNYLLLSQSDGIESALDRWIADPLFAPANEDADLQEMLHEIVRVSHASLGDEAFFRWPNMQSVQMRDRTNSLHRISAPTLSIVGERDLPEFQESHQHMLDNVPNIRGASILGAGHMSNMECPDANNVQIATFLASNASRQPLPGDLFPDETLTEFDIDVLANAIRNAYSSTVFDLNADHHVDGLDHRYWVHELANTNFGDSNLDGEFNSGDFVAVFQAGEYEDELVSNSSWVTGDWNGDAEFDSADFVVAFQEGGYEQGPRTQFAAVPEPSGVLGLFVIAIAIVSRSRSRKVKRTL